MKRRSASARYAAARGERRISYLPWLALLGLALAAGPLILSDQTRLVTSAAASDVMTVDGRSQRVKLGLNKSLVLDLPRDAHDILVSNPAVADAVTRTARRIYLFGKQVGQTNIFVFGADGGQIASLNVDVERDVTGLEAHLKRFLPESEIDVDLINDNVVLTGTVQTPQDASRAEQLARIFVTGGEATTGQFAQTAAAPTDGGGVAISNPDRQRRSSQIVNMLEIVGEDQVTLKVTVAEVSRSVMKQLGVNMIASGSADGIGWGAISENAFGLGKPRSSTGIAAGGSLIDGYLNAMEQSGVMKTLAEPALSAVSGEKATFRVGGEFNIVTGRSSAVSEENQTGEITYESEKVEYGIGLEFQPTVLSPGRISLKVRTSVSEPTFQGSSTLEGSVSRQLPGTTFISIRKRLADTTIELPSGGTMMIAGLVQDDVRQVFNGAPGLSKLPVLGALFRSRDFVRNETELVVMVTPYLSRPNKRTAFSKPDDNFNPPSDGAGVFLGRVNRIYGTMETDLPDGRYHGVVGYIYK